MFFFYKTCVADALTTQAKGKANVKERVRKRQSLDTAKEEHELQIELNQDEWEEWFR